MSDTPAPIADSAPLSVDQAAGLLGTREPEEVITADAPVEAVDTPSDAEPTAEELGLEPEEVIETEAEEGPEPELPAIKAPHSWDAEARAVFQTLPREAQQVIAARETARDAFVSKATEEAANTRKQAESEVQALSQLTEKTTAALQKVAQQFQDEWQNATPEAWAELARTDPARYVAVRADYEAKQQAVAELAEAAQLQLDRERYAFEAKKIADLKVVAPELLDPIKGPERRAELEDYILKATPIDRSVLQTLDASVIVIAKKAMLYDRAIANRGKQPPAPVRAAVRPAAATSVRTPQREAQTAFNRLAQTGSVEDAVALLNLRSK